MATANAINAVHYIQNRRSCVRRAACGTANIRCIVNFMLVDAIDDVGHIAFCWRRQKYLARGGRTQVTAQVFSGFKHTGVINHQRVRQSIVSVVNVFRIAGVNHLHWPTVDDQALPLFVDVHLTIEGTMDTIAFQQCCTLF